MVNTGKPSTGCYMCRSRRIKCDEAKPHCMRCQKSKRICPGYRDAFDLNLRDETKSIKRKASRAQDQHDSVLSGDSASDDASDKNAVILYSGKSASPDWINYYSSPTSSRRSFKHSPHNSISDVAELAFGSKVDAYDQHTSILQHLSTPIHQQAACFFLSNFVLIPEEGTMRGYLDFLIPILKRPKHDQSFLLAFAAVGFAALGARQNSKSLLPKADYFYVKALKQINIALQTPKKSTDDATLAAVVLLSIFEQLTASRSNAVGWTSHVDGAVALVKSRGKKQFQTRVGRDLGIAVRAHMVIGCIANSKPIEFGPDYWMDIKAYDEFTQRFTHLNLLTAELRVENDKTTTRVERSPSNTEAVLKLLRKAEDLEKRYVDWQESLPSSWAYRTVSWVDVEGADTTSSFYHPGRIDSYGELWMVYTYNTARSCRLFIWTTILRCVAWLAHPRDYRVTPEYTTAARVCGHLIEDIVASVPCFFGLNEQNDLCLVDRSNFACGSNDKSSPKGLSGIFSMWPIFVAAASDFATPSQRKFLKGRLKYIADTMGINQATVLVNAQLEHPSRYIYRERMNVPPTGHCQKIKDDSDDWVTAFKVKEPVCEEVVRNASVSAQDASVQVCITPKEQILFESSGAAAEQIPLPVPEDTWEMRFNPQESMTPDPPEPLEQTSFNQEIPLLIPSPGRAPTKVTGWTPRSFEDATFFHHAMKQSPDSELDFSNFVTV